MGVIAAPSQQRHERKISPFLPALCAGLLYAVTVALAAWHHEPWADEAQSWLLARDAGLVDLWTRLLHYEGTPGLWQTILHLAILAGAPYRALNLISAACGFAACCLILRSAPFPAPIRLALPFTFYLCYQYAVVARSYSLVPVLLCAAAILYGHGVSRIAELTIVLSLLAAVSVHGMALSISIWLAFHWDLLRDWRKLSTTNRRTMLFGAAGYWIAVLVLILAAWPASDNMFVRGPDWSFEHVLTVAGKAVCGGFAGGWILSVAAIALSIPLLWRGRTLFIFFSSLVSLSLLNGIVHYQAWHYGLIFLGWLFAVWVAAARARAGRSAIAALAIVICVQCYWTAESVAYDWGSTYSASRDAASYLRESGIARRRLFAIGYACVGIEPYFAGNIFANMNGGRNPSYWDWSLRNHVNEDSGKLAALRPDYVIVGYKGKYERDLWTRQIRDSGYRLVRHFEGNTFWQSAILEPESFDLYQRPAP
jgi:hypothetical protein